MNAFAGAHIYGKHKINSMKNSIERRKFLMQSAALVFSATTLPSLVAGRTTMGNEKFLNDKKPPLPPELVSEFVRIAHFDLVKVKEMLDKEPMLVNACWDWGAGDFETALGAASHVGNRDIAFYLLDHGGRKDIFCSAMLGDRDVVHSFVKVNPEIVNSDGPHKISLLYHVAASGDTKMANIVKPHVRDKIDFDHSLQAAVKGSHASMTEWLLKNGCNDPSVPDFAGNTPLQNAEKKKLKDIADLLKKHGAK